MDNAYEFATGARLTRRPSSTASTAIDCAHEKLRLSDQPITPEQVRSDDRATLERVYLLHAPEVLRLLRAGFVAKGHPFVRVPGVHDCATQQDVLQEVFFKAFDRRVLETYDTSRAYAPFLLQIAKTVHIDQARARQRDARLKLEVLSEANCCSLGRVAGLGSTQSNVPEEDLDRARLSAVLSKLDDELRQYYDLRYVEELAQTDVARQMGISRRHARTLESRLIHTCRRGLLRRSPEISAPVSCRVSVDPDHSA